MNKDEKLILCKIGEKINIVKREIDGNKYFMLEGEALKEGEKLNKPIDNKIKNFDKIIEKINDDKIDKIKFELIDLGIDEIYLNKIHIEIILNTMEYLKNKLENEIKWFKSREIHNELQKDIKMLENNLNKTKKIINILKLGD